MANPTLNLGHLYGTPVFTLATTDAELMRVYGATYLPTDGVYAYPAFHPFSDLVIRDLETIGYQFELSPEAAAHVALQRTYPDKIKNRELDPGFTWVTKPYEHQIDATAFSVYNLRAGLFLDMGLGKTKVAIDTVRYANQFLGGAKALVVVPRVILMKWADEVTLHSGGQLHPVIIDGTPKKKLKCIKENGDVHICTYGTASSMENELMEYLPYNTVIVDESHNLQTPGSDKTKAVTSLSRKAARRMIMSGTASLGDPRHLYGQLDFLGPFLREESFWKFSGRYVQYKDMQRRIVVGYKNLDILHRRVNLVGIRRKKDECLDLPERTFVPVEYALDKEQKSTYNELVLASHHELEEKLRIIEDATPAARLTKLLQICSGWMLRSNKNPRLCDGCPHMNYCVSNDIEPYTKLCTVQPVAPASTLIRFPKNPKMAALTELLESILAEPTNKVVIWGKFLQELTDLEVAVAKLGVGHVRVDGSVGATEMAALAKRFQTDADCRVYIGQISTGVGIELTAANYMVYYSLSYNLGDWLQSQDRAHRIGQLRNVTVYTLLNSKSVEGAVYAALMNKEDIRAALTNKDPSEQTEFERRVTRPKELD